MTLTINLPNEHEAALNARARAEGVSAEEVARQLLTQALAPSPRLPLPARIHDPKRPIWEVIAERAEALPSEVFERLPEDGASQHDHYIYGLPKR
ncbi:MAG: CopG family transcriptional regulator [Bryobacteraceae bacterium]